MLRLFRNYNLGGFVSIFLFSLIIHLAGFILPLEVLHHEVVAQDLYEIEFFNKYPILSQVLAYISNCIVVILLVGISKSLSIFGSRDLLIPYLFLVFCGCSFFMLEFSVWHLLLIGHALLIYIVLSLYEMVKDKAPLNLFVLGFIAGLFILVDSTNLLYLLVILWGVVLFKPSQKRDVFVFLLGFVVILFFIFSIYFLQGFDEGIRELFMSDMHVSNRNVFLPFQPFYILFVILIIGVVANLLNFGRNNIFTRKVHKLLIALLLVNVVVALVNGRSMFANAQNFAILFGIYGSHLLQVNRIKWIPEVLNGFLLFLVFWYQYDYFLPVKFQDIPSILF